MRVYGWCLVCVCVLTLAVTPAHAQVVQPPPSADTAAVAAPQDPLGRSTPRGTLLGFLATARKGELEVAKQYLNTRRPDRAADDLARQLFVVLDARLPARLAQVSDVPEGSRANPLSPDTETIGTIQGDAGPVEVVVERVVQARIGPVWLFSRDTLDAVPALYEEIIQSRADARLPRFLVDRRIWGMPIFGWLAILLGLPGLYLLTGLVNRALTPVTRLGPWRRVFGASDRMRRTVLPAPARVLIVAVGCRWLVSALPMSLLWREFWVHMTTLCSIVATVWLLILLNGEAFAHARRRLPPTSTAAVSLLGVARRAVDALVIFLGMIAVLRHFAIDPTPALAGLGVGGIAVALAAQKTLENVIAGASLIFDQAVNVGDTLKMGEIVGTVEHIGLRSTRIRTLDRTLVSVPNSQIANASLETISARDKFWFHPILGLRYETTSRQLEAVLDGLRLLLETHPAIDRESIRVRFLRLGAFSLDVEVFAYLHAPDWSRFLEMQEQLLFRVTEIVAAAGTGIAFPSQTMYVEGTHSSVPGGGGGRG